MNYEAKRGGCHISTSPCLRHGFICLECMNTRDVRDYLVVEAHITQCFPISFEAKDAVRDNVFSVWASSIEESTKKKWKCGGTVISAQIDPGDIVTIALAYCKRVMLKEDETRQTERLNKGLALSDVHYVFAESL